MINNITYSKHGVPVLKRPEIEVIATDFLKTQGHYPSLGNAVDMVALITDLEKTEGLVCQTLDCGSREGAKILGCLDLAQKKIIIDTSLLQHDAIRRFTEAHEIGHWVLHRHQPLMNNDTQVEGFADHEGTLSIKHRLITTHDWIEWQANAFAASLLMPQELVMAITIRAGHLLELWPVGKQPVLLKLSHKQLDALYTYVASRFGVSKMAAGYRLKTLMTDAKAC